MQEKEVYLSYPRLYLRSVESLILFPFSSSEVRYIGEVVAMVTTLGNMNNYSTLIDMNSGAFSTTHEFITNTSSIIGHHTHYRSGDYEYFHYVGPLYIIRWAYQKDEESVKYFYMIGTEQEPAWNSMIVLVGGMHGGSWGNWSSYYLQSYDRKMRMKAEDLNGKTTSWHNQIMVERTW